MAPTDQIIQTVQLKRYKPIPVHMREYEKEKAPCSPSEWFSKHYSEAAERWGTPFLESVYSTASQSQKHIQPIAVNDLFFAAILNDESLGHELVYHVPDQTWYFKDVRDKGMFKPTTDAKLKNLLSLLFIQSAEQMPEDCDKFNLFVSFRKDQELQAVVEKAKSLFSADGDFFDENSRNERRGGDEHQKKVAKLFIKVVIEVGSEKSLTVSEGYAAFREFCKLNGGGQIDRNMFEPVFAELVKNEYGLGLRHDVPNLLGKQQRGWRGLGLKENRPIREPEISDLPAELVAA
jgi:hypothetical protein